MDNECDEQNLLEINTAEAERFIKKTEISYIIENQKLNILQELDNNNEVNEKNEEKIFRNDGSCDISLILELRKSHEAFSRSDRPCRIRTQITIQESQNGIDQNLANHLVNQLSNNPQSHQIVKRKAQRWKGRNQIQSLINSSQTKGK